MSSISTGLEQRDRWEVTAGPGPSTWIAEEELGEGPGTVVVIDKLDRLLPERHPATGGARRRFRSLERRSSEYLGMVFHRFLTRTDPQPFCITVNGEKVRPWDPFAPDEECTIELASEDLEIDAGGWIGHLGFTGYVLPHRDAFSSTKEFERLGGPRRWNRQQGLYVYRADRMIQSGGWSGIRAIDEHTKLARAALDLGPELDEFMSVSVAKMNVALPTQVRKLLDRPVHDLCHTAERAYRRVGQRDHATPSTGAEPAKDSADLRRVGLGLTIAASEVDQLVALDLIMARFGRVDPATSAALGW